MVKIKIRKIFVPLIFSLGILAVSVLSVLYAYHFDTQLHTNETCYLCLFEQSLKSVEVFIVAAVFTILILKEKIEIVVSQTCLSQQSIYYFYSNAPPL